MGEGDPGPELEYLDPTRLKRLKNRTCPYCGSRLESIPSDEDHVIGRKFVPKGTLKTSWNLALRACQKCNVEKSGLEDDISAITMQPDAFGQLPRPDALLRTEAERKGKGSFSRRTKRPVAQSQESIRMPIPFAGGQLTFEATAPPQVGDERAFALARMQLAAFFYWITFDRETGAGGFWPGGFHPVIATRRADWGNALMRGFADYVVRWEPRVLATAAEDFFRVAIRRHPEEETWSWALEWNAGLRLIGFFGERAPAQAIVDALPHPVVVDLPTSPTSGFRYREEVPLAEEDDRLFSQQVEPTPPDVDSDFR